MKYINPKTAFFILVTILSILLTISIPLFTRMLSAEWTDATYLLNKNFFLRVSFGLVAGVGLSILGTKLFVKNKLVRSIRFLVLLLITLTFLMYISVKVVKGGY